MGIVQEVDGVLSALLILFGLSLIFLQVAVLLKWIRPARSKQLQSAGMWEVLLELVKKLPATFLVGLMLIYCGVRLFPY